MQDREFQLFSQEMADVVPLKQTNKLLDSNYTQPTPGQQYRLQKAQYSDQEINGPLSLVLRKKLSEDDWVSYKRNGIQNGVYKNLRLGKYPHESTLNLTRKTPSEARDELLQFLNDCDQCNIRSVLIIFGRSKQTGVTLKSFLAQWLPELEQVQAFHTAQKHHGGGGSIYVLLRKSERKRQENKERHAARLGN